MERAFCTAFVPSPEALLSMEDILLRKVVGQRGGNVFLLQYIPLIYHSETPRRRVKGIVCDANIDH